uniref:DUF1989 domain-containing protein n=1 Tax=uncultured Rhizobium sp. TaxID=155567 RepID=UPI002639D454
MQETVLSPPRPSLVLQPGLRSLPPGTERYRIRGGGSVVVRVAAGDTLTLTDVEGCQPCEVSFVDPKGQFDAGALGTAFTDQAEGLKAILTSNEPSAARTLAALRRRNVDLARAGALRLFSDSSPAGTSANLSVSREGLLIVVAPGAPMAPDAQSTATPIELQIRRNHIDRSYDSLLPEPMADPLQDIRVRAAHASAYFVRAGEFIQIIDVSGRQCTDFQAFAARNVDKGLDLALDATITRTLLGRSYPTPGLPSKAFDRDFQPLVEIVQDTVGRHDAFATACNARYYDDMGYPGHINCTDNFNHALAPYGIAPRKGWEAINYFYNTHVDHNNQLYLDEPWSRPGDYVLMRAMTCVSSSCPDDIDAANGWNPTDIHVRTFSDKEKFTRAVAYRMTPDADAELTRETAFHPRFAEKTRDFADYRGYWLAN